MAGVVVGLRLDNRRPSSMSLIFQLAQLAITVLFPLLAADVSWGELSPLGWGGVACVLCLMLYRRLVVQAWPGWGIASLAWREQADAQLGGPARHRHRRRGQPVCHPLDAAGVSGGGRCKGLVFLTILLTVGLQGFSAALARPATRPGESWKPPQRLRSMRPRASPLGGAAARW